MHLIFTNMELKWEKPNEAFGIVEGNEGMCWGQKVHKSSKMGPPHFEFYTFMASLVSNFHFFEVSSQNNRKRKLFFLQRSKHCPLHFDH